MGRGRASKWLKHALHLSSSEGCRARSHADRATQPRTGQEAARGVPSGDFLKHRLRCQAQRMADVAGHLRTVERVEMQVLDTFVD